MLTFQIRASAFAALTTLLISMFLAACGSAKPPYTFSAITNEISMQGEVVIDVRLIHGPTGKPVVNAVIFETRFDMSPDSMGSMTAPVETLGTSAPGIYRFKVSPTMVGRWALTLSAKVQGVDETVTGTVVVTVR